MITKQITIKIRVSGDKSGEFMDGLREEARYNLEPLQSDHPGVTITVK